MSSVSVAIKRKSLAHDKFFANKYALKEEDFLPNRPAARTCRGVKTTETPLLLITVLIKNRLVPSFGYGIPFLFCVLICESTNFRLPPVLGVQQKTFSNRYMPIR